MTSSDSASGSYPYPTNLSGTQVWLGDALLPLSYAGPGQVNAFVPLSIAPNTTQTLLVQQGGTLSAPYQLLVADVLPGIFAVNGQGSGQGAVLIANTTSVAAPVGSLPGSRPVQTGEYLEIYCAGLGAVNNAPADGQPAPSSPPWPLCKPILQL